MGRVHVELLAQQGKLFRRGRCWLVLAVRSLGIVIVVHRADIHRHTRVDQRRHGFMQSVMPEIHDRLFRPGLEQGGKATGQKWDLHLAQADPLGR